MKTLKTFLEVRRPKSADERKFMDKHIVVKHADRNGNGDDLFNAKNIKTIKREKEGHGYDTGKDAKVYEGKLDEAPIKLTKGWGDGGRSMRANKAKLAGKNLPNDPDTGTPDHFTKASRRKRGLSENVQHAILEYFDEMGIEVTEIELGELAADLQEEILGELSNNTLKSYIKKAGRSATYHDDSAENLMGYAKKWKGEKNKNLALDGAAKSAVKSVKRVNGIIRAAKKIKEDVQLDELSKPTLGRYIRGAMHSKADAAFATGTLDKKQFPVAVRKAEKTENKRENGVNKAIDRLTNGRYGLKESNEELDELFSLTIEDLSDKNQELLTSLYESLDLENQINLVETLQEDGGLDAILDFALDEAVKSYQVSGEHKENGNLKTLSYFAKNPAHAKRQFHAYYDRKAYKVNGVKRLKEETLDESCIAGTKKVSSHEGKDGHTHEIRYDKDNEEYSVHHYKDGKHLGEGPVSYHSDKQEAKDQVAYDVKNFKR